jgi:hypothetical protein
MSRFHEAALRDLGRGYEADPAALSELERRAAALGVPLPASFVEWYGMRDGIELLRKHGNSDWPVEISELGDRMHGGQVLPFMFENQGVCR